MFLKRQELKTNRVWWIGVASVLISIELLNISHMVYVQAKSAGVSRDLIVAILDDAGILGIITGMIAIAVSAFMPIVRQRRNFSSIRFARETRRE